MSHTFIVYMLHKLCDSWWKINLHTTEDMCGGSGGNGDETIIPLFSIVIAWITKNNPKEKNHTPNILSQNKPVTKERGSKHGKLQGRLREQKCGYGGGNLRKMVGVEPSGNIAWAIGQKYDILIKRKMIFIFYILYFLPWNFAWELMAMAMGIVWVHGVGLTRNIHSYAWVKQAWDNIGSS